MSSKPCLITGGYIEEIPRNLALGPELLVVDHFGSHNSAGEFSHFLVEVFFIIQKMEISGLDTL